MTRQSGFALLMVLWAMAVLALAVAQLAASGRSEAQLAGNLRAGAELQAAADGAIHAAIFAMLRPGASRWPATGDHVVAVAGTRADVQTQDQAGLVNPNTARPALLRALLQRIGMDAPHAESLADAIVDWRTPGTAPRPHGAKADAYRAAGLSYGPPGSPFETTGELRDVLGMTPSVFAALAPHLTVLWDDDPDIAEADAVVAATLLDVGVLKAGGAPSSDTRVVVIRARARRGAAIVTRMAAIRLGFSPDGRPWRVLTWGGDE